MKRNTQGLFSFLLIFFLFSFLSLQLLAGDPLVKYIGIENGLSNNAVTGVYQDSKGFMWFTTYDGLNKYDGNTFTVFRNRIGDSTSLVGSEIYTIAGDRDDNLWIGGRGGVSIYYAGRNIFSPARYYSVGENTVRPISFGVLNILMDGNGSMLVATEKAGLVVFAAGHTTGDQTPLVRGISRLNDYRVTAIGADERSGAVWLMVQNVGLCRYSEKDRLVVPVNDAIRQGNCLKTDGAGGLWLGNDNGLFKYDVASNRFSGNYIDGNVKVCNLCIDRMGRMWIASDGKGVLWMDGADMRARPFLSPEGKQVINSSAVYSIYEDKQGRKWVGTLRGGINVIDPRPNPIRTILYQGNNPNNNFILSFCEDPAHNVWIGTDGGGLRYWNRQKDIYTVYMHDPANKGSVGGNFVTGIINDAQNDIWVSTWYGGVSRLNKARGTFDHYTCFNPSTRAEEDHVWLLYEDRQKRLWASTSNDGTLYILNREKNSFELFDKEIVNVQCMAEDKAGNLWGGNYSSLIRIDPVNKKHQKYDLGYTVRCMHEDRAGNFWIGTQGGGLLLYDRGTHTYQRFDDADGLRSNTILRILEDPRGNLWMSTFNGLLRFDAREKRFRNFSQSDGLQSNQFSFNAAVALRSGEFLFGGIKGFNIFYPDSVYREVSAPEVYLTGIRMEGKAIDLDGESPLRVPYDKAALSFDFVAPEYSAPDKLQYAYYLEGWDKHWNYSNTVRVANYSRLQEGTYHFMIKATDVLGRWGAAKPVLSIVVQPPWYRTWWAYLFYSACVAAAIYIYIIYTKRQERLRYEIKLAHLANEKDKELQEKKLSFFTNISHEFRTPLTLIIDPLKGVVSDPKRTGKEMELTTAYRNARRLLSLVDQLLLFRKADSGADILKIAKLDITALCSEVFQCFTQQARSKGIDYQFVAGVGLPEIYGDGEKIEIALFNLLSNAFKFTPDGGVILLHIGETEKEVVIAVEDSGCGIKAEDRERIFEKFQQADDPGGVPKTGFGIGLYLVRHFIESHGGRVQCVSEPEKGTVFSIILYKGTSHLPQNYIRQEEGKKYGLLEELSADTGPLPVRNPEPVAGDQGKQVEEIITGKRSLLLIDDDAEIRGYLEHIFADRYLLYQADNGEEGLRLAQQHVPDLIISDIHMQGMDGVELCQKIKRSESLGHIPVILLTGATGMDTKLKGIEGGADDYITKPFDSELLVARVETILRNRNLLQRYFFDSITLKETAVKVPAEYQDFLRKCIEVIERHIDTEDFTTPKFAKAMGMSRSALYQKVKSISGQSLNAFIRSIRLRRAAVLMLTETLNVNQAAFQVGIGDARYFREQFVKLFGMTPSEYIKKYRHSFNRDFNVIKMEDRPSADG